MTSLTQSTPQISPHTQDVSEAPKVTPVTRITWSPPDVLTPTLVLPDYRSDPARQVGKETDPGQTGIFLCLLDNHNLLHPSLQALHIHRSRVHGAPLPADMGRDPPANEGVEWVAWRFSEAEEVRRAAYLPLA